MPSSKNIRDQNIRKDTSYAVNFALIKSDINEFKAAVQAEDHKHALFLVNNAEYHCRDIISCECSYSAVFGCYVISDCLASETASLMIGCSDQMYKTLKRWSIVK